MNSMKDMDYRLNTLRVCYLIVISVLALYGQVGTGYRYHGILPRGAMGTINFYKN